MALTKNQYFTDSILALLLGSAISTPSSIKMVLTKVVPTRTDNDGSLVRADYAGYADTTISPSIWSSIVENNTTGSTMTTNTAITFPSPSATPGTPVIIVGVAIIDDANNILYQAALNAPLQVSTMGQPIVVPSGSLSIAEL